MTSRIVSFVLLLGASSGCNRPAPPNQPQTAPAAPAWVLSAPDDAALSEPMTLDAFEIRVPPEFRFIKQQAGDPKGTNWIWVGPIREDETYAHLIVTVVRATPEEQHATLEDTFDSVLETVRSHRDDWSQNAPTRGTINGLSFIRASWSGVYTASARAGLANRKVHGIVYAGVYRDYWINVICQDTEPNEVESQRRGELAVSSLRPAPAAP